jgi:hypothetical protein
METNNEQTPERVTVKSVKIDDEVFALDVVKRGEKRFVFEIMRSDGTAWLPLVMSTKRPSAQRGRENRSGSERSRLH